MRRLTGVGVGPGDPELMTVKAVRALLAADAILVPATEASAPGIGRAESIVLAACPEAAERIVRVPFSMADRTGVTARRAKSWYASADAAVTAFEAGAMNVAFATIGDPSVYSTFSYLAATVLDQIDDVSVHVIPGITAMQALAAASRTPLVEGDEVLALVPLKNGLDRLKTFTEHADTTVIYKAGRHFAALRDHLAHTDAIVGINVGLPDERIAPASTVDDAPYFATVLVPAKRDQIGGRI